MMMMVNPDLQDTHVPGHVYARLQELDIIKEEMEKLIKETGDRELYKGFKTLKQAKITIESSYKKLLSSVLITTDQFVILEMEDTFRRGKATQPNRFVFVAWIDDENVSEFSCHVQVLKEDLSMMLDGGHYFKDFKEAYDYFLLTIATEIQQHTKPKKKKRRRKRRDIRTSS